MAQNADQPFVPASVTKIVTAWLALAALGPDYRFKTRFYLDKNRVLYIRGGGDPYLISEELAVLAPKLVASDRQGADHRRRARRELLSGDLRIPGIENDRRGLQCAEHGARGEFQHGLCRSARATPSCSAEPQTPITPAAIAEFKAQVARARRRISLTQDPAVSLRYAGELIMAFFEQAGGVVKGPISTGTVPEGLEPVYVHREFAAAVGDPRRAAEVVEQLYRQPGLPRDRRRTTRRPRQPREIASGRQRDARRERPRGDIHLEEGSGISRDDRFTARGLARVLALFAPHADLLRGHDGGLNKTGTMSGVSTLAGYADTSSHGRVRFVISLAERRRRRAVPCAPRHRGRPVGTRRASGGFGQRALRERSAEPAGSLRRRAARASAARMIATIRSGAM